EDGIRDRNVTGVQTCALPIVIGDALGISRQAAFQRFGTPVDPRTGEAMNKPSKHRRDVARAQAESFLDALTAHQWEDAAQQLGPAIGSQLDAEGLAASSMPRGWQQRGRRSPRWAAS